MTIKAIGSFALAIGLSFSPPASARPVAVPQVRVDLAAFALGTSDGRRQLDQALQRAAMEVCGVDYSVEPLEIRRIERDCFTGALHAARQRLAAIIEKQDSMMLALGGPGGGASSTP